MAHRLITQVVVIGSRVLGRAFTEAYKQAQASSSYQRAQAKVNPNGAQARGHASLTNKMALSEAYQILNVKPPVKVGPQSMDEVLERYKRLYDANEPEKGGSFYLQSKVVRARERIEAEIKPKMEQAEMEAEIKGGWKPKIYKD